MMQSVFAAVFVLGLPVWLTVEQIVAITRSAAPARPAAKRVVRSVAYQNR